MERYSTRTAKSTRAYLSRHQKTRFITMLVEVRSGDYFFAAPALAAASAYFFVNRSTRPAVSISFCLPVKKG
jgi:hypothetical protein